MKKNALLSISCLLLSMGFCGCQTAQQTPPAAQESSQSADDSVTLLKPGEEGLNPSAGEETSSGQDRLILSATTLEININPQDTKDIVPKLKTYIAENDGYVSYLISDHYELEEETETEEEEEDSRQAARETAGEEEADAYDSYYDYDSYDYYSSYYPWTEIIMVLPDKQSDALIKQLLDEYKLKDSTEYMVDRTIEYQNLLGRIEKLEDEEQRLISILEEARSSADIGMTSDPDSTYLSKVMALENSLWSVRRELTEIRYGSSAYSSYYYDEDELEFPDIASYENLKGKRIIDLEIYVDREAASK